MPENRFLLPLDEYKRELNPIGDWLKQTAFYASKTLGKPYDACYEHLKKKLQTNQLPFINPEVVYFERGDNGDREKRSTSLTGYLSAVRESNEILAPTLTSYLHPDIKTSFVSEFLEANAKERKTLKKTAFKYKGINDGLYQYYWNAQDCAKRTNNSVSGGFVAEGSVINNRTGHSTLTSITRSIASLSNASNERLIEGSRHYFSFQIALNNLISIASTSDLALIDHVIAEFHLVYPTVEDVMACVTRSTTLYRSLDRCAREKLMAFVVTLTPTERAAVVYTGDLYHLRILNDAAIRDFITALSAQITDVTYENPIEVIKDCDEAIVNYAHQICMTIMTDIAHDYTKIPVEQQCVVAATCKHIEATIEKYQSFIKAFFLTKNSPATIATIQLQVRRAVVLSDTDSTMFSVASWVEWYFGAPRFDDPGFAVAGAIMFMATQSITHILALFSANMNVAKKHLTTLAMKPEFVFPVFAQTSVSKHYYTAKKVQEGSVYKDIVMEIKGVHLKDSSVPTTIITEAAMDMEAIIRSIMRNEKIDLMTYLMKTEAIERDIIASVYRGETRYLKRIKIKQAGAYKLGPEKSPYAFYTFWEEVFAPSYAHAPDPVYDAIRIPLDLKNKQAVKTWIDGIEDRALAGRLVDWMTRMNKAKLGVLPIPMEHCTSNGVPTELKSIINIRKIVLSLTKAHRNILESLGFFSKHELLITEQAHWKFSHHENVPLHLETPGEYSTLPH